MYAFIFARVIGIYLVCTRERGHSSQTTGKRRGYDSSPRYRDGFRWAIWMHFRETSEVLISVRYLFKKKKKRRIHLDVSRATECSSDAFPNVSLKREKEKKRKCLFSPSDFRGKFSKWSKGGWSRCNFLKFSSDLSSPGSVLYSYFALKWTKGMEGYTWNVKSRR